MSHWLKQTLATLPIVVAHRGFPERASHGTGKPQVAIGHPRQASSLSVESRGIVLESDLCTPCFHVQRHGYCTLGEAFNRLDFSTAILDSRRFNYVVRVSLCRLPESRLNCFFRLSWGSFLSSPQNNFLGPWEFWGKQKTDLSTPFSPDILQVLTWIPLGCPWDWLWQPAMAIVPHGSPSTDKREHTAGSKGSGSNISKREFSSKQAKKHMACFKNLLYLGFSLSSSLSCLSELSVTPRQSWFRLQNQTSSEHLSASCPWLPSTGWPNQSLVSRSLRLETTCLGRLLSIWNTMLGAKNFLRSFSKIFMMNGVKQMSLTVPLKSVILFNWFIVVSPILSSLVHFCQWFNRGGRGCVGFRLRSRREFTHKGCWLVGFLFSFSRVLVLLRAGSLSQMIATVQPDWWHSSPLESWIIHLSSGQMQAWPSQLTWYPGLLGG